MSAVRGTRTPSPFPRITGFQDRPGTSCGITAKSTRGGIRTRKSLRTHSSGPCLYNHFHAPGQNIKYRRRGSNPQNPASKAGTYSSSVTPAKNTSGGDRTRKRPGFLVRRIFRFCYRGIFCYGAPARGRAAVMPQSTPGGIRTLTVPDLGRLPLPIGITGADINAYKKAACAEISGQAALQIQ